MKLTVTSKIDIDDINTVIQEYTLDCNGKQYNRFAYNLIETLIYRSENFDEQDQLLNKISNLIKNTQNKIC